MRKLLLASTAAIAITASGALADAFTDAVIADLQSNGYHSMEITTGLNQLKVEATDGTNKIEIIYDLASGEILKKEIEPLGDDVIAAGIEMDTKSRDFLGENEEEIEDQEDESDEEEYEDDDDEDDDDEEDDEDEDDEDDDDDSDDD